jgi:cytochrome c oxidase subunit II
MRTIVPHFVARPRLLAFANLRGVPCEIAGLLYAYEQWPVTGLRALARRRPQRYEFKSERREVRMNKHRLHKSWMAGVGGVLALCPPWAMAAYDLNLRQGVTEISRQVYDLHMIIFYICCAIAVVVFGALFYSIIAFRKSAGAKAAHFHESTAVEIVWTVVPMLILVAMAIPATKTLINMADTTKADMSIKVTGHQWRWQYTYLDDKLGEQFNFISSLTTHPDAIRNKVEKDPDNYLLEVDNRMVVPVNKKVRILTTASDVIHAWWVPDFGWKLDAIPGFVNESWFKAEKEGTYRGQCTELCGKDHGFMPIVVDVVSEEKYNVWAEEQRAKAKAAADLADMTQEQLMTEGAAVYAANCAGCHGAEGQGTGTFPALKGSKVATGPLADHVKTVVNGRPGTVMPAFASTLTDKQIAAVVTYERNAWGNNMGDMIQPKDVKAAH